MPEKTAETKVVSVVGARRCTRYGEDIAYRLGYELAKHGVIVVSGLAYGIDSCAHRGCLDGGGVTVAVLGTPIDQIYPRSNQHLAQRILERGAILSEYPPGAETRSWNFLHRNRIVASLADALVVVEAAMRSGTRRTVDEALELGTDVYAVPGDIYRSNSAGCNDMLRDSAHPFVGIDEFLSELLGAAVIQAYSRQQALSQAGKNAQQIVRALENGVQTSECLIKKLKMGVVDFNRQISLLELSGVVQSYGANAWILRTK